MKIGVVGAGGWGTAFARLLACNGHNVILWARRSEQALAIEADRENRQYLTGVVLPRDGLSITADLDAAIDAEVIVLAVPSFAMAEILERFPARSRDGLFVSLAKGMDRSSQLTMSELIEERLGPRAVFALSGPSHAEEVGRDVPTAVVLAGHDLEVGKQLQHAFATPRFRIYLSADLRGVELCATVKNVIALATGVSDGLGYGDNSRGALITRGLAEMVRFGVSFGVRQETFFGLSGLGDLVATCTSPLSRNRRVGERLGRGEPLTEILEGMTMVAEGVHATGIVHRLAHERGIEMPITDAVRQLLDGAAPLDLVDKIMTRAPKREDS
ncbi:MAG: NAD(P)-dependent glycerol-3-phosphate dehydrogenase [Candidatus Bipolaricaulota bacterium]|nr:MAG: NAD(P)-dependent glycerol-3-phosphate dehydrogenase [Candidatus Bipolaricaulota bacterium]